MSVTSTWSKWLDTGGEVVWKGLAVEKYLVTFASVTLREGPLEVNLLEGKGVVDLE